MKRMKVGALVMAAVLAVTGCDLFGVKDTASGPSAPDMGSPSAIPASEGTVPATSDGAKQLFVEAFGVYSTAFSPLDTSESLDKAISKNLLARQTQTQTTPLDQTISIGGGTITTSGSMTTSVTMPDSQPAFKPNYTYNDIMKMSMNLDEIDTITNVTLPEGGNSTYTFNGKAVAKAQMNMNVDWTTGATEYDDVTYDMDISMAIQAGYAVSVKRNSDNAGAKFILSYTFDYAKNNLLPETFQTDFVNALQAKKATLKVYDDSNNLKYSIDLSLDEPNLSDSA